MLPFSIIDYIFETFTFYFVVRMENYNMGEILEEIN